MRLSYLAWSAALCGLSLTTFCPDASAQLGRPRDVVISAERLFGLYGVSRNYEDVDSDVDPDDFSAGFLMQGAHLSPVTVPRVALDVFIIERLSLGGSLGLYSNDMNNGSTGAVFSPRVGYSFAFNQNFGFWPKAGFTYYSLNDPDRHHFSLSLEGAFVFMPNPTVGFTATPFFDLGLSGEDESGPVDLDYVDRVGGVAIGMFARF